MLENQPLINADVGEGCATDDLLIRHIDIANIACGGHAGDQQSMQSCVRLSKKHSTLISAHPSYPDKANFGRESQAEHFVKEGSSQLIDALIAQLSSLKSQCDDIGTSLTYIKPHGALYHDSSTHPWIAEAIITAGKHVLEEYSLIAQADGHLSRLAEFNDIPLLSEAFIDRRYQANGKLVPRSQPHAIITDTEEIRRQFRQFKNGSLICEDGEPLVIDAQTLCLHGDNPNIEKICLTLFGKGT